MTRPLSAHVIEKRYLLSERFIRIVATGLGSGLSPLAPGTMGTVVGIRLYLAFSNFPWPVYLLTVVAMTALAIYTSGEAERLLNRKDAPCIVIDEIVGMQWTMFLVTPTLYHIVAGFILFRIFDIIKVFPANVIQDRLPGGYGVVMDDVAAGIWGNAVLLLMIRYLGL